mmetsp:Transcript_69520/g.214887  ORF Transcript_69520/g.214887 Transcript_69520/m.214887 type:complete len:244 (-) Transcript_69520:418-1149(-)
MEDGKWSSACVSKHFWLWKTGHRKFTQKSRWLPATSLSTKTGMQECCHRRSVILRRSLSSVRCTPGRPMKITLQSWCCAGTSGCVSCSRSGCTVPGGKLEYMVSAMLAPLLERSPPTIFHSPVCSSRSTVSGRVRKTMKMLSWVNSSGTSFRCRLSEPLLSPPGRLARFARPSEAAPSFRAASTEIVGAFAGVVGAPGWAIGSGGPRSSWPATTETCRTMGDAKPSLLTSLFAAASRSRLSSR